MNRIEFLNAYPGKLSLDQFKEAALKVGRLDWDGAYGEQCVDLFRFYCHCVLGMGKQPAGVVGAKDFYVFYENDPILVEHFVRIENTLEFIPQPGDVCIWYGTPKNPYGHISIAIGPSDVNAMTTLDQNVTKFTIGIHRHNYNSYLGVLRPKE